MKLNILLCFLLAICLVLSCTKPPDYPVVPEIGFKGFTKNFMDQGFLNEDSLMVTISFTDGDGDLGDHDSLNLFITDKRTGFLQDQFRIPFIPEQGASNGISGEISFALYNTCCIFSDKSIPPCTPNTQEPLDTLIYSIYIKDRSNNLSNVIETEPIFLQCD